MSIGPISAGFSLFPNGTTKFAQPPSKPADAADQDSIDPDLIDQDSTDPKDIIAEIASGGSTGLIKYQEKQIEDKVLKSLGLTEASLKNLPPDKKNAIEDAIAKAIKESLLGTDTGSGGKTAASGQPPATPTNTSLISSSTWNSLVGA
jgi:hypothetical protein